MAKATRTTRPNTTPAATASRPSRVIWAGSCLVTSRMTTLAATKMAPSMTVTAAVTARTMTSCTLLAVAVLERTAQRSHRGYRLASHMADCKLSFPAGMLNFRSTCGVCDSWGLVRDGIRHCEWSGGDGCLLGEVGDRGFVGAVCLAQR